MNGRKGKVMVKTEGTAKLVEQREEKSIFTITSIVTCITIKRGLSTVTVQKVGAPAFAFSRIAKNFTHNTPLPQTTFCTVFTKGQTL